MLAGDHDFDGFLAEVFGRHRGDGDAVSPGHTAQVAADGAHTLTEYF